LEYLRILKTPANAHGYTRSHRRQALQLKCSLSDTILLILLYFLIQVNYSLMLRMKYDIWWQQF